MATGDMRNVDLQTVTGFGREWSRFPQGAELPPSDHLAMFTSYFALFPWHTLPPDSVGMDIGCGSGRWAMLVAPRVGHLHLVDPSPEALDVAQRNLGGHKNVTFHLASVADLPVHDRSLDFAYALGVLHHVPDTAAAIQSVARKLKAGAPFLVYLYYAFDNRPAWYRGLWRLSDLLRRGISRSPPGVQRALTGCIAAAIYWPLARSAALFARLGVPTGSWPLSAYGERSFYVMRTDAHDRFCTPLEKRFTRGEIETMLTQAGFDNIRFSDRAPYWCAVATKT